MWNNSALVVGKFVSVSEDIYVFSKGIRKIFSKGLEISNR